VARVPELATLANVGGPMSRPTPPLEVLEKMGRGNVAVFTSIACLSAALAVQRGDDTPPTIETIEGDEPMPNEVKAELVVRIERIRREFLGATPEILQAAIDLYVAHLKYCGFRAEWGQGSDS
jgi:hypothetical protein